MRRYASSVLVALLLASGCGGSGPTPAVDPDLAQPSGGGPDLAQPVGQVPMAPTGLTAVAGDGQVTLGWVAAAQATGYNVYRSTSAGMAGTKIASPSGTGYTDTAATNGTTFYYQVTAINANGESAPSTQQSATPQAVPAPTAPANLAAVAKDSLVTLTWSAVAGATSYSVYRSTSAGSQGTKIASAVMPTYTDGAVTNGTTYYYQVTSSNAKGESSPSKQISASPAPAPGTPTGFAANPRNAAVILLWNAVAGATDYNIYRSTTAGVMGAKLASSAAATNYLDTTVTNGTTYYYRVTAVNGGSESAPTAQLAATPQLLVTPSVSATAGNTQVVVTWNIINGAASYDVYRSTTAGSQGTKVGSVQQPGANPVSYTDTGLANGTTYYYQVVAIAAMGMSAPSTQPRATPYVTRWAQALSAGTAGAGFNALAVDPAGSLYAAGFQSGTGTFGYGNAVSATGNSLNNVALVKYNAAGTAQWAKTNSATAQFAANQGKLASFFYGVAVDGADGVYAAGTQGSDGGPITYDAVSSSNSGNVLVKYSRTTGMAQWVRTPTSQGAKGQWNAVATDAAGNVYAVGLQFGNQPTSYAAGVSVQGSSTSSNALIVKYDSNGNALWARSVTATMAGSASEFDAVAVDGMGNVYAAGEQDGTDTFTYGNMVTAAGLAASTNIILVKYDPAGAVQWARTVTAGTNRSRFNGLAVDGAGNVYAAGSLFGNTALGFGNSITATGAQSNGTSLLLVKYNGMGMAQWATSAGGNGSELFGVAVDNAGNIFGAGYQYDAAALYGGGITNYGGSGTANQTNAAMIRFDPLGAAVWVQLGTGNNTARLYGAAVDSMGNIYGAGNQLGSFFNYNGQTTQGPQGAGQNPVVVGYR